MELRHLRYFVAVAQEQHMTRAAAWLGIQQPPLSQQIKALEEELGVQLFERSPRKILLNAAGRIFLQDARALLADADAAVLRVKQAARGELGRIAVGYTNSSSLHALAPRIIRAFRAAYPLVTLAIEESLTNPLFEALAGGRLDIAFVRASSLRYPGLRSIVLCHEPMIVALPGGHPLTHVYPTHIPLSALSQEDFVLYRRADGPGTLDAVIAACQRAGFSPHVVEEVPRLMGALTQVAAGRGVTLVPETMSALHTASVSYRTLDVQSAFSVPLNLAYREPGQSNADDPVSHFIELAIGQASAWAPGEAAAQTAPGVPRP